MEAAEDAGETVTFGPPDPDDLERLVAQDRQNQEAAAEAVATMDPWEVQEYLAALDLEAAKSAATERLGRGAMGMSERSRRSTATLLEATY